MIERFWQALNTSRLNRSIIDDVILIGGVLTIIAAIAGIGILYLWLAGKVRQRGEGGKR